MGAHPLSAVLWVFLLLLPSIRETGCCCVHAQHRAPGLQNQPQLWLDRPLRSVWGAGCKSKSKITRNLQFSGVKSPEPRICLQSGCENVWLEHRPVLPSHRCGNDTWQRVVLVLGVVVEFSRCLRCFFFASLRSFLPIYDISLGCGRGRDRLRSR